jgi:protoporphyrinogen oxidase
LVSLKLAKRTGKSSQLRVQRWHHAHGKLTEEHKEMESFITEHFGEEVREALWIPASAVRQPKHA